MRKLITFLAVLAICFTAAACGQANSNKNAKPVDSTAVEVDSVAVDSTVAVNPMDTNKLVK